MNVSVLGEVVEGQTAKIPMTLTAEDVAIDGTGLTLTDCLVTGRDGTEVTTTAKFNWEVQASGTVYFKPAADDLLARKSPYRIRFKVTDGNGDVVFFPDNYRAEIVVLPPRG